MKNQVIEAAVRLIKLALLSLAGLAGEGLAGGDNRDGKAQFHCTGASHVLQAPARPAGQARLLGRTNLHNLNSNYQLDCSGENKSLAWNASGRFILDHGGLWRSSLEGEGAIGLHRCRNPRAGLGTAVLGGIYYGFQMLIAYDFFATLRSAGQRQRVFSGAIRRSMVK